MVHEMFTRPPELSDERVVDALAQRWHVGVAEIDYAAIGFGSHHWRVADDAGGRWFVTVDDLLMKRSDELEPLDAPQHRLVAALATARALRDAGLDFVVAPVPIVDEAGAVVHRLDGRFTIALYPHVDGEHRSFGAFPDVRSRLDVLDRLVAVHRTPRTTCPVVMQDDLVIPCRQRLEALLDGDPSAWRAGPFGERAGTLLARHAEALRGALDEHDRLVAGVHERPDRLVITHGEPHPGNTIVTSSGVVLIDWDTVRVAPPERDLWSLVREDPAVGAAYTRATGVVVDPDVLRRYGLAWDLTDISLYVAELSGPHDDTEDTRMAWRGLEVHLDPQRWVAPTIR
jgi:spectinomycin phosphotransferase